MQDFTNTHDWNEAQGRCLICDATDCSKPCPKSGYAIFTAFEKWINQRPGLETGNYFQTWRDTDGRRAYNSEVRSITAQRKRALAALYTAQRYPFNPEAMQNALSSAFAGRLSWTGTEFDYTTGQYWPTEYRAAAASVLEAYAEAVRPKHTPGGRVPQSISELKAMVDAAGGHFFSRENTKFFRSRTLPNLYIGTGGVYFITSEEPPHGERRFTVRQFDPQDASIDTVGPHCSLSRGGAQSLAREMAEAPKPKCRICVGSGKDASGTDCWRCKGTGLAGEQ
jgi:hypothetical protein